MANLTEVDRNGLQLQRNEPKICLLGVAFKFVLSGVIDVKLSFDPKLGL